MARIPTKQKMRNFLSCLLILAGSLAQAQQPDKAKYITVDEIRPGMQAYCLTVYKGTEVEKFDLEVLDIVRNVMPGRDAILVQGTDERFIHTGPVLGCSGSPVYIDGRLAGALAFAFAFSKDPFYGVTPIEEMLRVGRANSNTKQDAGKLGFAFDFSKPIDLAEFDKQITAPRASTEGGSMGVNPLPCPLITSGLPDQVVRELDALVRPYGLVAVQGLGAGTDSVKKADVQGILKPEKEHSENPQLVPGACLAVPLITGDMTIAAIGTVTEVTGDKVYGFGHRFLGYGPVDLPMATGQVHTVVSNLFISRKFASALEVIGALTSDESTAVFGRIGAMPRMIPLTISVDRYNDPATRVYNCQLANNRIYTPLVLRWAMAGAALMLGRLPPDHMIQYKVTIDLEDAESLTFQNVSTRLGLAEMMIEGATPVAILMNNPYKTVQIGAINIDMHIASKNVASHIWSVDLSDSKVRAGEEIEFEVVIESFLAEKRKYQGALKIPEELVPGKYDLLLCGGYAYLQFLRKEAPYRFIAQNLSGLIEAMNNILRIKRDKLYCVLVLPPAGVALEKAELPDLPGTKALILSNAKRTLRTQPYQHWVEKSYRTGTVIVDKKVMQIIVE